MTTAQAAISRLNPLTPSVDLGDMIRASSREPKLMMARFDLHAMFSKEAAPVNSQCAAQVCLFLYLSPGSQH